MSFFRTALLLAGLTALFMGVGYLIGGQAGMMIAFVVAVAMNLFSYWNSDKLVLSMNHAVEVDDRAAPELVGLVRELAGRAGLPMPRVYLIDEAQPNAFATGRDPEHAAVAATTGLMRLLSREEIAGVMAHELAHVKHRDTLIMTVTATIAGAISMLANFGMFFGGHRDNNNPLGWIGVLVAAIVAPFAAMLVQMAISRTREYAADRGGAEICGDPAWLASALRRLEAGARAIPNDVAEANPATAHMFIVNPLIGKGMDNLFSTHPATENRVAALRELAAEWRAGGGAPAAMPGGGGFRAAPPQENVRRGPWGADSGRGAEDDGRGRSAGFGNPSRDPSRGPWGRGGRGGSVPPTGDDRRRGPWG